jgi:ATP-binding cassette, subfamily B, multidrug efflux pump
MPRAAVSAQRIIQVLQTRPSLPVAGRTVRRIAGRGRVELTEVTFSYPAASRPALRGVSLAAEPGQLTAITGSTGSGKTTLISLIPRLADPSGGRVLLDGVDMRELAPAELARAVGYVPQRAYLFAGTIATNLRFGSPGASDAELWRALEIAQARDFVAALPGGLTATVASGGTNLSGGQRQRLAIARALVHQPQIYLFDDTFSALDQATSAALRAALAGQMAGATTIVVTQQLATVTGADRIVVLDGGQVAGAGTHGELMRSCTAYQEIAESQDITQRRAA